MLASPSSCHATCETTAHTHTHTYTHHRTRSKAHLIFDPRVVPVGELLDGVGLRERGFVDGAAVPQGKVLALNAGHEREELVCRLLAHAQSQHLAPEQGHGRADLAARRPLLGQLGQQGGQSVRRVEVLRRSGMWLECVSVVAHGREWGKRETNRGGQENR